ncbi:MAG: S9 family peptidase [Acidobacteria bacterium]|nr:S9 family peptidase [Acidobacteriota bacterium]
MTKFISTLLLVLSFACVLFAQQRLMTPNDVIALKRITDVQLANDSRRTVFVATAYDEKADRYNSDLWTALADMGGTMQRLTYNAGRDDHPRWSPTGQRLAFLSERGEMAGAQIYALNLQGGEAQQLTNHLTAVQSFEWSPDGRFIAFIAAEPTIKPKEKTKPPIVYQEEARPAQLWLLDVESQQIKPLTKGTHHVTGLAWSFDRSKLAVTARQTPYLESTETTEVFLLPFLSESEPVDLAAARQLTRNTVAESQPRFSPDGRWLAWLARAEGSRVGPDRIHLFPVNAVGAGSESAPVTMLNKDFTGYIRSYRWLFNNAELLFNAATGVNEHIYKTDLSNSSGRAPQQLTRGEGVVGAFTANFDGTQLVYAFEHTRMGQELAGLNARTLLPMQLTHFNPQVETIALGQVETIRWKSGDKTEIEGLLIYPVGYDSSRRYPLMTYIHGGPEGAYANNLHASWSAPIQVLAGAGYAVFLPNFRGSSNYGAAFAEANALKAGQIDADDVMTGIDHLIQRGLADADRLAIGGWSYGGYLSGWLTGHTNRFKCAVYGAGLSNAVSYWGTADITSQRERLHGGTPWTARQMYEAQSPLTFLPQAKTPTLIFHGEKDERVPLGQSQESYRALKRANVPVQLIVYPDQGHGLLTPSYQLDKMTRELAWLKKYLEGR